MTPGIADPSGAIWHDFADDGREPLDVVKTISNTTLPVSEPLESIPKTIAKGNLPEYPMSDALRQLSEALSDGKTATVVAARRKIREEAIDGWRGLNMGHSNDVFYPLADALYRSRMSVEEIKHTLFHEAAYCRSTIARRSDIPRILKRLSQSIW